MTRDGSTDVRYPYPMSRILVPILLMIGSAALAADHPGLAIYKKNSCHLCHGADGSGNTPTGKAMKSPDLRAATTQNKKDDALAKTISKGAGKMPAFKALTPEQVGQLVAYIRTFKK